MENQPQSQGAEILVRVWGMAEGHAFFQNAHARNISTISALLVNVEHPLKAEDVVGVQYGDKKARFRVLRVSDGGLPQRIYAEVQLLEGQTCPWQEHLAQQSATPVARRNDNKRQFPRLR